MPARNRVALLNDALEALERQTFRDFEVIVVDDASSEDLGTSVEAARNRGLCARLTRNEGTGAVAARCTGVALARGEILAFTDSDCRPDPAWLFEGVKSVDAGADVVQGVTVPARPTRPRERSLSFSGGEGLFATCNVFYTRSAYERAGGFDRGAGARLGFRRGTLARGHGFGEDTLLGWRVAREGVFAVSSGAVVRHAVLQPTLRELFSRACESGAFPALVREVPELRRTILHRGLLLGGPSRIMLYPGIAFGVLRWPWWMAACAVGWMAWSTRAIVGQDRSGASVRIGDIGTELALELTTTAALIAGSVRARTLVL